MANRQSANEECTSAQIARNQDIQSWFAEPFKLHEGARLLGRVNVRITSRVNLQVYWSQQGESANSKFHLHIKMMNSFKQLRHQQKLRVSMLEIQTMQVDILKMSIASQLLGIVKMQRRVNSLSTSSLANL